MFPDFSRPAWRSLKTDQRAAAIAAAGVLTRHQERTLIEGTGTEWFDLLMDASRQTRGQLSWVEPRVLADIDDGARLEALAEAWWRSVANVGPQLRLERASVSADDLFSYLALMRPRDLEAVVCVETPSTGLPFAWRWPIRVGFLPDAGSYSAEGEFRRLLSNEYRLSDWVTIVDPFDIGAIVDVLFITQHEFAQDSLRLAPAPFRARLVVLLDVRVSEFPRVARDVDRMMGIVQASGVAATAFGPERPYQWWPPLFDQLSAGRSFPEAFAAAAEAATGDAGGALLCADDALLSANRRVELELFDVRGGLDFRLPGEVIRELGKPREAPAAPEFTESVARFVQHRLVVFGEGTAPTAIPFDTAGLPAGAIDGDAFYVNRWHALAVRIAPETPEAPKWKSANVALPEEDLPPDDEGHMLALVLSEPTYAPEPQLRTVFLPRRGASSIATFQFDVQPQENRADNDWPPFVGRLMVLHENRILQTLLLEGTVIAPGEPQTLEHKPPSLRVEGVVRPLDAGLDGRRRYAEAMLFNHTTAGDRTMTRVAGSRATLIRLDSLDALTRNLRTIWDESRWEQEDAWALDGTNAATLLVKLAQHGRDLYKAVVQDEELDARLVNGRLPLQVIKASDDYHLPLEICYERQAPGTHAKLCPHAATALASGRCHDQCRPDQARDIVCPVAFWGLNRVIEWHGYRKADRDALSGAARFAVQSEPTPRQGRLQPLRALVFGASHKIPHANLKVLRRGLATLTARRPTRARSWKTWRCVVRNRKPGLLLLMVHTDLVNLMPSMEIGNQLLDPPDIDWPDVKAQEDGEPPLVLLLGCGTGTADVPFQKLPAKFRRSGAAIVVSSIAELLDTHAPRLAALFAEELASVPPEPRTFGDVMLAVRRRAVAREGLPIAMALVAYGDADWLL